MTQTLIYYHIVHSRILSLAIPRVRNLIPTIHNVFICLFLIFIFSSLRNRSVPLWEKYHLEYCAYGRFFVHLSYGIHSFLKLFRSEHSVRLFHSFVIWLECFVTFSIPPWDSPDSLKFHNIFITERLLFVL